MFEKLDGLGDDSTNLDSLTHWIQHTKTSKHQCYIARRDFKELKESVKTMNQSIGNIIK